MQPEEGTGWLLELLSEVQLQQYFLRLRDDLNVTRLSHFEYVKNEDLEKIGMGRPGRWDVDLTCLTPDRLHPLSSGPLSAWVAAENSVPEPEAARAEDCVCPRA